MVVKPEYILALDYGEKRIGVAIAHEIARLPRPLTTLDNTADLLTAIKQLLLDEHAYLVVVGLPRSMNGSYSAQTKRAEDFAHELAASIDVPVELIDETLTSVDAEQDLQGKAHDKKDIDAVAASYILERYLAENPAQQGVK